MDPRLRARRISVARTRGRRRLRRVVALVATTALVAATIALSRSSLLDVDAITVTGASRTGRDRALATAGIERGRAMTSVDSGAAEARLEALPWVADATVDRRWPGAVRIRVRERVAVAIAGAGAGAVLVDRAGRILGSAVATDHLPLAGPNPVEGPGGRLPEVRLAVVRMLADLPAVLRSDVARGTVGPRGLGLVLKDGIVIHLGDRTRLQAKADAIIVLLAEADRPTLATIDVAVANAAAVTRVEPTALTNADAGGA